MEYDCHKWNTKKIENRTTDITAWEQKFILIFFYIHIKTISKIFCFRKFIV